MSIDNQRIAPAEDPVLAQLAEDEAAVGQQPTEQLPIPQPQLQTRRKRCFSRNHIRIIKFVLPFLVLCIGYTSLTSLWLLASYIEEDENTNEISDNLKNSGIFLQIVYICIAVREILITLCDWTCGKILDYNRRLQRYIPICCFDGCVVLGVTIWNTVALADTDCSEDCGTFYNVTLANVIIGYIYYCAICCLPGPCLIVHSGSQIQQNIQRTLIEDFGQP